jgi:hypothetical protein
LSDPNTEEPPKYWKPEVAFEVWKHHASIGGADKDRMIKIASLLLGFSAAIVGFTFKEGIQYNKIVEPVAVACLAFAGIIISCASAVMTLLYGGYANRNWAKADQIADDYGWKRLSPSDSPFAKAEGSEEKVSRHVTWALNQSASRPPHKQLAPIFEWFFALSLISLMMHLAILFWSIWTLSCRGTA